MTPVTVLPYPRNQHQATAISVSTDATPVQGIGIPPRALPVSPILPGSTFGPRLVVSFKDSTLVLIGHGSTLNRESATPTRSHADALRNRGVFGQVLEAYWKQEPSIAGVLRAARFPTVFVVPLFISEGYFTEQVIPRELGLAPASSDRFERTGRVGSHIVHYCGPVGTHPSMTHVLARRALEVVRQHPAPHGVPQPRELSVFIAGHGTGNSENSRKAIEDQVQRLREAGQFNDVHGVFMEEEPRIGDCHSLAGTPNIVMVPFFISDGLHSYEDIPVLLGADPAHVQERLATGCPTWISPTFKDGHWIWYSRSIGDEPHLPEVILERVREAGSREPSEVRGEGKNTDP